VSGASLSTTAVWKIVLHYAHQVGIEHLAPHDLRRTCAKLCRESGGDLERDPISAGTRCRFSLFVAATDGNLSARLDEERILATPTAMSKGTLRAADMVIVDPAGRQVAGRYRVPVKSPCT
jgi:hypothetical protein